MSNKYSNMERKVWKLKRKNVKLGQQKRAFVKRVEDNFISGKFNLNTLNTLVCIVAGYSEQIGKNSYKIQKLRLLLQQEKKVNEHSNCT